MMMRSLLSRALVVAAVAAAAAGLVQGRPRVSAPSFTLPRLSHEFHSQNDIGGWRQALRKGVRWFKLDISVCVEDSCRLYSSWDGDKSDCFVGAKNLTYCCLCMRGDTSLRPFLVAPFNTTDDMIRFLGAPENAPLLTPPAGQHAIIHYGLDFGNTAGVQVLSGPGAPLMQRWLFGLHDVITSNGLSIEPYLDAGMCGFFSDVDDRCGPQSPTRGSCSALELQLQAIPWPCSGGAGTSEDAQNRTRVYNADWTEFKSQCENGFTPVDMWEYPYLEYEPSSEWGIATMLDEWRACPSVPADRRDIPTGMSIVSNQGPEMVETFGGPHGIGRGGDALWVPQSETSGGTPRSVALPLGGAEAALLAVTRDSTSGESTAVVSAVPTGSVPDNTSAVLARLPLSQWVPTTSTVVSLRAPRTGLIAAPGVGPVAFAVADSGAVVVLQLSAPSVRGASPTIAVLRSGAVACPSGAETGGAETGGAETGGAAAVLGADLVCPEDHASASLDACAILAVCGSATALRVAVFSVPDNSSDSSVGPLAVELVDTALAPYDSADVSALSDLDVDAPRAPWAASGLVLWSSRTAPDPWDRYRLYGAHVHFNTSGGARVSGVRLTTTAPRAAPRRMAFGQQPHVLVLPGTVALWQSPPAGSAVTRVVLETHTTGSCQCGFIINNGDAPRCLIPTPVVDDDLLMSGWQAVPGLLNYNWGRLGAWADVIAESPNTLPDLSFCHPHILSGKFESGWHPSAAVFPQYLNYTGREAMSPVTTGAPGTVRKELAAVWVFDGWVLPPLETTLVCGSPTPKGGTAAARFHLVPAEDLPE